ncbi:hypothetical protein AB0G04_33990 [Actinoplanes sp. NPDC023801]
MAFVEADEAGEALKVIMEFLRLISTVKGTRTDLDFTEPLAR